MSKVTLPAHPPVLTKINPRKHNGRKWRLDVGAEIWWMLDNGMKKRIVLPAGMLSDGATWAWDIRSSWSWITHDNLCDCWMFADRTPCTAWQASQVLSDILEAEGKSFRKYSWKWATFLLGSWKIKRKVGWL